MSGSRWVSNRSRCAPGGVRAVSQQRWARETFERIAGIDYGRRDGGAVAFFLLADAISGRGLPWRPLTFPKAKSGRI